MASDSDSDCNVPSTSSAKRRKMSYELYRQEWEKDIKSLGRSSEGPHYAWYFLYSLILVPNKLNNFNILGVKYAVVTLKSHMERGI